MVQFNKERKVGLFWTYKKLVPFYEIFIFEIIIKCIILGYYRVNYAKSLWEQLATALQKSDFDGIVELNRAQIVDDLFALARANYVDYSQLFNYTSFLSQETSYYTWYSAFSGYNFILTKVGLDSTLGKKVKVRKFSFN